MKTSRYFQFGILLMLFACSGQTEKQAQHDNTSYVNPFIGTGGHGHTFPGATVPYGMVQLSPDTRTFGWDACGGYHHSDSSIIGFSHTHLSGTGISDLGDFLFMPFSGEAKVVPGTPENPDEGYRSRFRHETEKASPGYYSVLLDDDSIQAELTATLHAGFHRYTFNQDKEKGIIIDLSHTIYPDHNPSHEFQVISDTEIAGYKGSGGWAKEQHTWFYAKFSQPFHVDFSDDGNLLHNTKSVKSKKLLAFLTFPGAGKVVMAKVGISHVDYAGAKNNLDAEIKGWNFEDVHKAAKKLWAKELDKIQATGGTEDDKTIFYTSLYHTCISPNTFSDVDGRYRGMDQQIHQADGKTIYTVFSLWDTFRAAHPLKTILDPQRDNEFIETLLTKYDQGGMLPMWELVGNYTGCMIGYHSVPVIVDAYFKGIRNFDVKKAYKAMVETAAFDTTGILFPSKDVQEKLVPKGKLYNETMGFIPCDIEVKSVSKALEYAYNDWCIAQMAKELGYTDDYSRFMERSKRYVQYYDKATGFMRGKNQDGTWREPFDPRNSQHKGADYTEGNAFQWSWFVPHDVNGLIDLVGGKEKFAEKLDTLFSTSSELTGTDISGDITGLIGQYAHGNEPSHHITHLYNFAGQSWKTQKLTDQIMRELYFNNPNGLAGNEDCGQMSAWYVLNAMGFYSFCPGQPVYSIGRPIFDQTKINLPSGKTFTVLAKNNAPENKYIQAIKLNGAALTKPFFTHDDILMGGVLEFEMGPEPNKQLFN
jgi:predicted alpha-1,2-mannosidase